MISAENWKPATKTDQGGYARAAPEPYHTELMEMSQSEFQFRSCQRLNVLIKALRDLEPSSSRLKVVAYRYSAGACCIFAFVVFPLKELPV